MEAHGLSMRAARRAFAASRVRRTLFSTWSICRHSNRRGRRRLAVPSVGLVLAILHVRFGAEPPEQRGGGHEPAVAHAPGGELAGVDASPHRGLAQPEHGGECRLPRVGTPDTQHHGQVAKVIEAQGFHALALARRQVAQQPGAGRALG